MWGTSEYKVGWSAHFPPALKWLLVTNFVVFCLQTALYLAGVSLFDELLALWPLRVKQGWVWQLFTYMFLHAYVMRWLVNLLLLLIFGMQLESDLGSRRFLSLYFLAGVVGGLTWSIISLFLDANPAMTSSAAVYAVLVAFATMNPDRPIMLFPLPVTLSAKHMAILTAIVSLLLGLRGEDFLWEMVLTLSGMLVGYLYIKMRISERSLPQSGALSSLHRLWKRKPTLRVISPSMHNNDFMQQRIDPILDKIAEHGIQSLTREERHLLDEAKDRLQ